MRRPPRLQRPSRLRPGDRLAAVSPSWGGPGTYPSRYEAGVRQLEARFGVEVVAMPSTLAPAEDLAAHPERRLEDLHAAFTEPSIAGIVATIGGDDAIRWLPGLDLELVAANPKVVLGYSDTTILHLACLHAGLTSFYGPSIMSGFAENAGLHGYLVDGVEQVLFRDEAPLVWPEDTAGWTVEFLDWADPELQARPRTLSPPVGRRWFGGEEPVEGPLVVGCLEVLQFVRGTRWWPDLDGAVLALETSEEAPPPAVVTRFLRSLVASGELEKLAAILFARPGGANVPVSEHHDHDDAILEVVREAGRDDLPVVTGLEFGHTDPMWTLPLGVPLRVDPAARQLVQLEPAVT